jgi:TolB-like protein/Flp pilus assembly protein TadD
VLPLDNHSPDEEQAWFAEAMTEEITTALSRVPELRVKSRSTGEAFPGSGKTLRAFAREVGVAHVIEGSVRRVEDDVRITVQLIDARTVEHVWSETYEAPLADVLETQIEIARQVADRLAASFSERERERIFAGTTDDPVAYDLYLRANELNSESSVEVEEKAELLERALERDPEFAMAWAELAESHYFRESVSGESSRRDSVRTYLDRAIELAAEPALEATFRAAKILMLGENPEEAIALLRRTVEQNPSDYSTAGFLGLAYWFAGDLASTVEWMHRAAQLNPLDPAIWSNIAWYYTLLGLDDRAERALRRSIEIAPDRSEPWGALSDLRLLQGRYTEAVAAVDSAGARGDRGAPVERARIHVYAGEVERALAVFDSLPSRTIEDGRASATLAHARRVAGDTVGARETLERAEARMESQEADPVVSYMRLELAAAYGDADGATEALRRYVDVGGRRARIIRRDPIFEDVRADAAFEAELAELERIVERQRRRVERENARRDS